MSNIHLIFILLLGFVVLGLLCFTLGRLTLEYKIEQLKKENRMMRDLLKKINYMENLNRHTFCEISREFIKENSQKDVTSQDKK